MHKNDWTVCGTRSITGSDRDTRITERDGYRTVLLIGNRLMTTTSGYQTADAYARSVLPGARLLDTGENIDGRPQRRYIAFD